MHTALVIIQFFVGVGLVGLVLIQHGKGADAGAAFGSGASGTVFGARGSANFLSRTTAYLATAFFIVSLLLAYWVGGGRTGPTSVMDQVPAAASEQAPAVPDGSAPAAPAPVETGPKVPE
jgi:preprotein translocase subunit SecG